MIHFQVKHTTISSFTKWMSPTCHLVLYPYLKLVDQPLDLLPLNQEDIATIIGLTCSCISWLKISCWVSRKVVDKPIWRSCMCLNTNNNYSIRIIDCHGILPHPVVITINFSFCVSVLKNSSILSVLWLLQYGTSGGCWIELVTWVIIVLATGMHDHRWWW